MRVWVDASILIALESIGEVLVLRDLLGQIAITPPIADEVFTGRESQPLREARGGWIEVVPVRGDRKGWTSLVLGIGEASLFETPKGARLILDEIPARTVAEAEGRDYTGLLGLLLAGVEARAIPASRAREILEKLARSSFRMSSDLYGEVLRRLGTGAEPLRLIPGAISARRPGSHRPRAPLRSWPPRSSTHRRGERTGSRDPGPENRRRAPWGQNPLLGVAESGAPGRARRLGVRETSASVSGRLGHATVAGFRHPARDESHLDPGDRPEPAGPARAVERGHLGMGRLECRFARRCSLGCGVRRPDAGTGTHIEPSSVGDRLGIRRLGGPVGLLAIPAPLDDGDGRPRPVRRSARSESGYPRPGEESVGERRRDFRRVDRRGRLVLRCPPAHRD